MYINTFFCYDSCFTEQRTVPPLPFPKHHVCPQTLSSFGWCLLAPLAASWPLFCCKLVVFHGRNSQPAVTISRAASVVIIKITQRSDSFTTGNGQKSMQFHWKDGRGRWILWRNLCSIWPPYPSHLLVLKSLIWKIYPTFDIEQASLSNCFSIF